MDYFAGWKDAWQDKTGQATSNCAIGNGGSILYLTADSYLPRLPLK